MMKHCKLSNGCVLPVKPLTAMYISETQRLFRKSLFTLTVHWADCTKYTSTTTDLKILEAARDEYCTILQQYALILPEGSKE